MTTRVALSLICHTLEEKLFSFAALLRLIIEQVQGKSIAAFPLVFCQIKEYFHIFEEAQLHCAGVAIQMV